ncbi:hypothetical protein GH714_025894 [Hevea brasiliensis]|uniref:Uncharacterized protein n=1 Tax=Hevea brasiliensis TaxID=3981 RepID=A0A6A6KRJ5_HEVBR|nr:hypothetical protein GH714_025894 [Hevea brasiliensis]
MRLLQNSISGIDSNNQFLGFSPLAPLVSPRWNNLPPQRPQLHQNQQQFTPLQQGILPSLTSGMLASQPQFQLPSSPPPFGCLNSPRSPHPLFSPGLLLSPSSFPSKWIYDAAESFAALTLNRSWKHGFDGVVFQNKVKFITIVSSEFMGSTFN